MGRSIRRYGAVVGAVLVLSGALVAQPASAAEDLHVLQFAHGTSAAARASVYRQLGLAVQHEQADGRYALVRGSVPAKPLPAAITAVSPTVPVRASGIPDDPLFDLQWNLRAVQAPAAWDRSTGAGATVAVLDTGVDRTLSDLEGTRIAAGIDLVESDGDPDDDNGHGTHVVGTIAQATNNGLGVAGIAHDATILPVKVLDVRGGGLDYLVAQGIRYAVDQGAQVLNLSLGAPSSSLVLYDAVRYASTRGALIVAAVGNEGQNGISFPAAYDEVLAVGAVGRDLRVAPYSNRGPALDLVAPGGVLAQDLDGDGNGDGIVQQTVLVEGERRGCFCLYQGTSMATPHVAATAALLVADGVSDVETVRAALLQSARDLGAAGPDNATGHGLLQAADALTIAGEVTAGDGGASAPPTDDPSGDASDLPDVTTAGRARDIDDTCPPEQLPDSGFSDVADDNVHRQAIACVAAAGIAQGVAAGRYAPAQAVTRQQMATFLARMLASLGVALPDQPPDAFTDDAGSPHERAIDQMAAIGVIQGRIDGTFQPTYPVTRGQMASFLGRAVEVATATPLGAQLDYFSDDDGSTHEPYINALAERGVAAGTGFRTFDAPRTTRRDQMASFLARSIDLALEEDG